MVNGPLLSTLRISVCKLLIGSVTRSTLTAGKIMTIHTPAFCLFRPQEIVSSRNTNVKL